MRIVVRATPRQVQPQPLGNGRLAEVGEELGSKSESTREVIL
jgi:hypothetical protein